MAALPISQESIQDVRGYETGSSCFLPSAFCQCHPSRGVVCLPVRRTRPFDCRLTWDIITVQSCFSSILSSGQRTFIGPQFKRDETGHLQEVWSHTDLGGPGSGGDVHDDVQLRLFRVHDHQSLSELPIHCCQESNFFKSGFLFK